MNEQSSDGKAPAYDEYPLDMRALGTLFAVGLIVGALGWLLYLAIAQYFIAPVFCDSPATYAVCRNGGSIAWIGAHIIAAAVMVAGLAKLVVYRPLLVAIGVIASLWMAHSWLGAMAWYLALAWHALLFGVATAAFGWVARAKTFALALILTVVLIVVARWLLFTA